MVTVIARAGEVQPVYGAMAFELELVFRRIFALHLTSSLINVTLKPNVK